MTKALMAGLVTHELLANTMPFYCCWLIDKDDETKPDANSVAAATMLYSVALSNLVPPRVWKN